MRSRWARFELIAELEVIAKALGEGWSFRSDVPSAMVIVSHTGGLRLRMTALGVVEDGPALRALAHSLKAAVDGGMTGPVVAFFRRYGDHMSCSIERCEDWR